MTSLEEFNRELEELTSFLEGRGIMKPREPYTPEDVDLDELLKAPDLGDLLEEPDLSGLLADIEHDYTNLFLEDLV